jgi:hypothetical protein
MKRSFLNNTRFQKKDQVINTHAWAPYRRTVLQNIARGPHIYVNETHSKILLWSMTSLTVKSPAQSGATKLIKPCWGMTVWPQVDRGWCFHRRLFFNLIFLVPSIMLYSSEISPTRCNNCVFILRNGFTLHVSGDNLTHHQEYICCIWPQVSRLT